MVKPTMKSPTPVKIGDKKNRLTAVKFLHVGKHFRKHYLFDCECGNQTTTTAESFNSGNTKSCGCLSIETKKAQALERTLPNDGGTINQIILQYKRHAKGRGFKFLLDREESDIIFRMPCFYCDVEGGNLKKTKTCKDGFRYNGIDRKDSKGHYTSENVVPCCGKCNISKGSMSHQEFIENSRRIVKKWGHLDG